MAVFYKLYQMMEGKTGVKGMWRVHVVPQGKVDIDGLAKIMEKNSTVKASDIKAVLYELVDAMQRHLLNGDRVVVDGFGAFKVNIKSKGVDALTDFKVAKDIEGLKLIFSPSTESSADKTRLKLFVSGATAMEIPQNANSTSENS
jgi:predicted histone-like DNA-binding protein